MDSEAPRTQAGGLPAEAEWAAALDAHVSEAAEVVLTEYSLEAAETLLRSR